MNTSSVAVDFFFFLNVWPTVLFSVIMIIIYVFLWHFTRLLLLLRNQTIASQQSGWVLSGGSCILDGHTPPGCLPQRF